MWEIMTFLIPRKWRRSVLSMVTTVFAFVANNILSANKIYGARFLRSLFLWRYLLYSVLQLQFPDT